MSITSTEVIAVMEEAGFNRLNKTEMQNVVVMFTQLYRPGCEPTIETFRSALETIIWHVRHAEQNSFLATSLNMN